ncbi:MFS transporter [Streptomyces sp. NBC_01353]|uniref:MFS transporter n=1 Tax=Streptomyces sp. NBC_01353 TaxID=2903835 RepID=UPI002E3452BC|nr:MFS transporter [Streptomyces sp. NBC_01353]
MTAADTTSRQLGDPTSADRSTRSRAWTVTGLLVVFMMINFADKSVLGLAADEIRADLGLSATQFGLANSAFFLLFSVAAVVVGMYADKVRPTTVILIMALLWSVAQVPPAIGGGLAVLIGSRIVLGAAEGPAFPVAQHATFSWFPDHRRNLPGALVTLGITLGVITAAPGLTWIIDHHHWRTALWVLAAIGLVWAVAWHFLGGTGTYRTADAPARDAGPDTSVTCGGPVPYRRIFSTPTWLAVTAAYFTCYWAVALMLVWLPSYLHNGLGYSSAEAGRLVVLPWMMGAVVLLTQAGVTGWLMRRGVSTKWARGGVGGAALGLGALACLGVPLVDGTGAKTALLAIGFGLAGSYAAVAATTVSELAPAARASGALGVMNAVVTTAGLAAPAIVGFMVDKQGTDGYQNAVIITGAMLLVGGLLSATLVNPSRDRARLRV